MRKRRDCRIVNWRADDSNTDSLYFSDTRYTPASTSQEMFGRASPRNRSTLLSYATHMHLASSNINELIRLLAFAVLLHELLCISDRGRDYLSRCVAPVFGLKLNRLVHSAVHSVLMLFAASLCFTADPRLLPPTFLLLSLTILSYSIRLSNHLIVSWFFFLTLTIDFL